jgi:hypothetical protein
VLGTKYDSSISTSPGRGFASLAVLGDSTTQFVDRVAGTHAQAREPDGIAGRGPARWPGSDAEMEPPLRFTNGHVPVFPLFHKTKPL